MDSFSYNQDAWDAEVERGNQWTVPVDAATVAKARRGEWTLVLTPEKPVPGDWYPDLKGSSVLCLASGGGQQGPVLAAAGAHVTVFDASAKQLAQDDSVAKREGLEITTVQGDMRSLDMFEDQQFDLVFHPCSNCFVREIRSVWQEAFRVLRPGGVLLSGFLNPTYFLFDQRAAEERGELKVANRIPYSEVTDLSEEDREFFMSKREPLVFGHSLQDQIGAQLAAGFVLTGMYEDTTHDFPLAKYMDLTIATRAMRPPLG